MLTWRLLLTGTLLLTWHSADVARVRFPSTTQQVFRVVVIVFRDVNVILRLRHLSRRTREAIEAARNRANLSRTVRAKWRKLRTTNEDGLGLAARLGDFHADVRRFSLRVRQSITGQSMAQQVSVVGQSSSTSKQHHQRALPPFAI